MSKLSNNFYLIHFRNHPKKRLTALKALLATPTTPPITAPATPPTAAPTGPPTIPPITAPAAAPAATPTRIFPIVSPKNWIEFFCKTF